MIAENSVAPWLDLRPGFYLDAAAKGASLGLERAKMETDANEAADRLRQSYASLAAQQAMHSQSTAAENNRALAALALHGAIAKSAEDARTARIGIATRHQDMLEGNAADRLRQALAVKQLHVGKGVYGYDPTTGSISTLLEPPPELSPLDKADYDELGRHIRGLRSALLNPKLDEKDKPQIQQQLNDALDQRDKFRFNKLPLPSGFNPNYKPTDEEAYDPGQAPAPAAALPSPGQDEDEADLSPPFTSGAAKRFRYNPATGNLDPVTQ